MTRMENKNTFWIHWKHEWTGQWDSESAQIWYWTCPLCCRVLFSPLFPICTIEARDQFIWVATRSRGRRMSSSHTRRRRRRTTRLWKRNCPCLTTSSRRLSWATTDWSPRMVWTMYASFTELRMSAGWWFVIPPNYSILFVYRASGNIAVEGAWGTSCWQTQRTTKSSPETWSLRLQRVFCGDCTICTRVELSTMYVWSARAEKSLGYLSKQYLHLQQGNNQDWRFGFLLVQEGHRGGPLPDDRYTEPVQVSVYSNPFEDIRWKSLLLLLFSIE